MIGEPKIDQRDEQPYIGIRAEATMAELSQVIPQTLDEVMAWMEQHGLQPAGPPFTRYYVIDMENKLDIEMAVPLAQAVAGEGRVEAGVLPAGQYASLVYRGIDNGIQGNGALLRWIYGNGYAVDSWDTDRGDAFASRYESFLTDPKDEPDPEQWDTEVVMKLAHR